MGNKARTVPTDKDRLFVAGKLRGESNSKAARGAGFTDLYARKASTKLRNRPLIAKMIAEGQHELQERAVVTSLSIIADARKAIEFGYQCKNPMSVIKGLSLIAEVSGLLVTKIELKATVDIGSAIVEAKQRAARILNPTLMPAPIEEPCSIILDQPAMDHHAQDHGFVDPFGD